MLSAGADAEMCIILFGDVPAPAIAGGEFVSSDGGGNSSGGGNIFGSAQTQQFRDSISSTPDDKSAWQPEPLDNGQLRAPSASRADTGKPLIYRQLAHQHVRPAGWCGSLGGAAVAARPLPTAAAANRHRWGLSCHHCPLCNHSVSVTCSWHTTASTALLAHLCLCCRLWPRLYLLLSTSGLPAFACRPVATRLVCTQPLHHCLPVFSRPVP